MNLSSKTVLLPSIVLLIGAVIGTSATNAFADDDPFKNKVEINTDGDNKNTCDESQDGNNNAGCSISDSLKTDTFTIQGEKNKVSLDLKQDNKNDCDESGNGNNNAVCTISTSKNIGPIDIVKALP